MTPTPARLFLALLALLLLGLLADRYVDPNPTWAVPSPPKPAPASLEVPKALLGDHYRHRFDLRRCGYPPVANGRGHRQRMRQAASPFNKASDPGK